MFSPGFLERFPILSRLFQAGGESIDYFPPRDDPERAAFLGELERLSADLDALDELLASIFPGELPTNADFFERPACRVGGIIVDDGRVSLLDLIWQRALKRLSPPQREQVLATVPDEANRWFFETLHALPGVLRELTLPPKFAATWLLRLRARLGNDLASGSYWATVSTYFESHPENGMAIVEQWGRGELKGREIAIAARALSALRRVCPALLKERFATLEAVFAGSPKPELRCVYLQSWVETAERTEVPRARLEELRGMAAAGTTEEFEDWFFVLTRLPIVDATRYAWALQWMEEEASPGASDAVKRYFLETVADLGRKRETESSVRAQCRRIVQKIVPLSETDGGAWRLLWHELTRALDADEAGAEDHVVAVAEKSAKLWLGVLAQARVRGLGFRTHPHKLPPIVTALLLSKNAETRWLGLQGWSELALNHLDEAKMAAADDVAIEIIFRECERRLLQPKPLAQLLGLLWPRIHRIGGQLEADFLNEAGIQARSTQGFREVMATFATGVPELGATLAAAENYFRALTKARASAALQMAIAGRGTGLRLHARRFSRDVSAGAKEHSILMRFAREMHVLYANRMTAIVNGQIGQSSTMQETSFSMETPRLDFMDDEGMMWRRLFASRRIQELEGGEP